VFFILLACIFDMLDGAWRAGAATKVLSDGVRFPGGPGIVRVAPAFLVHRIVLKDVFVRHPEIGWFIASVYLICGALRLARFQLPGHDERRRRRKEFLGFPSRRPPAWWLRSRC